MSHGRNGGQVDDVEDTTSSGAGQCNRTVPRVVAGDVDDDVESSGCHLLPLRVCDQGGAATSIQRSTARRCTVSSRPKSCSPLRGGGLAALVTVGAAPSRSWVRRGSLGGVHLSQPVETKIAQPDRRP